jgi:polar amino acid transport system substrate-binding protein
VNATPAGRPRRRPSTTAALGLLALAACATIPPMPPAVRSELAPTGKLRAGINHGNVLLASRDPASGEVRGIAVDLARELARRAARPLEVVPYESAGAMADAVASGAWDVAFLGAEPERASRIAFSPPYLEIEATYLVPAGSPIRSIADVDREGVRVAVSAKGAYDLFLGRTLRRARLVRAPGVEPSFELFVADKLDALAGLKPALLAYADRLPGSRVLDGRFTAVQQAIGAPTSRIAVAAYLREFVEQVKASGFVAQAIERHGVRGVAVAPPAAR